MRDIVKGGDPFEGQSPGSAAALAARDRLRASKWRFLEAHAQAQPTAMLLRPVRQAGEVIDFEWEQIGRQAAQMFNGEAGELIGRRLLDTGMARQHGFRAVVETYRAAAQNGLPALVELEHAIQGRTHVVRHAVTRLGTAVLVTLTDLTAAQQAEALWNEFLAQERTLLAQSDEPLLPARRVLHHDRKRQAPRTPLPLRSPDALASAAQLSEM